MSAAQGRDTCERAVIDAYRGHGPASRAGSTRFARAVRAFRRLRPDTSSYEAMAATRDILAARLGEGAADESETRGP